MYWDKFYEMMRFLKLLMNQKTKNCINLIEIKVENNRFLKLKLKTNPLKTSF